MAELNVETSGYVSPPANNFNKEEVMEPTMVDSASTSTQRARRIDEARSRLYADYLKSAQEMHISKEMIRNYSSPEDEDMDPSQYYEKRLKTLAALKAAGKELYPHRFKVSMSIPQFLDRYDNLETDQHMEDVIVSLAGRVRNKLASSELITYDLVGSGRQLQVLAFPKLADMDIDTFFKLHSDLNNGDIIGVNGFPGKSCMGELSIIPKTIEILSYCLHKLPPMHCNVKTIVGVVSIVE